ncbi:MAG: CHAD domain-containing protein [Phycisphaeraceae bacterium]
MSTLKRQEPVGLGLRRIACEHIEAGVRALTRQVESDSRGPGESIRRASAVLALIQPALPRETARRAQGLFDQVAEALASIDRPAVLLGRLDTRFKKPPSDAALAGAVKALRKAWSSKTGGGRALNSRGGSFDPAVYRLVADMAELRGHAGEWPVDPIDDDAPPPGLRRAYARARRLAGDPIDRDPLPELADALTQLRDQLAALSKACPPMLKAQRKLIDRVTPALIEQHADAELDRALRERLDLPADSALPGGLATPERVDRWPIGDLRAALAETPQAFYNRVGAYWSAWRASGD